MSAPVRHTCPNIDKAIQLLNDGIKELKFIYENAEDDSDFETSAKEGIASLSGIESMLEDLRSDNDALRNWGDKCESRISELEDDIFRMNIV